MEVVVEAPLEPANFDRWAEGAVHPDDVQKFVHADVTMGQVMTFMRDAQTPPDRA